MSRTYTQVRQLTAIEVGLPWWSGTADSSGSSTTILRDAALTRFGDDTWNGFHLLLTDGSPSDTQLVVKDFFQQDGDVRFEPELTAAPDSLAYELLPFSGDDLLRAIQDAVLETYDRGWLARTHWVRAVGGSPIYNADFSYWTSSTVVDGWTATTTTLSRERATANIALSETSVALTTAAGNLALDAKWQRYLNDFKGQTITLYAWVRASAASCARIAWYDGSTINYSTYHSGSGDWELLHVDVTTATTDTSAEPRLYADTTDTAYFNLPFLTCDGTLPREYPFTIATMPDGPYEVTTAMLDIQKDELASGRGLANVRQLPRQRQVLNARVVKHHDENTTTQLGVMDFSQSTRPPAPRQLMWLRGDGPLTVPTSALSTDSLEVTQNESVILATMAAQHLLEHVITGRAPSVHRAYATQIQQLQEKLQILASGAGEARSVAKYSLGW